MSTADASTNSFEQICSIDDIRHRGLVPFLSSQDLGRLEQASRRFHQDTTTEEAWRIVCGRDFDNESKAAPAHGGYWNTFDTMETQASWKTAYEKWFFWKKWTSGCILPRDMMESIRVWTRLKNILEELQLSDLVGSLEPCLSRQVFQQFAREGVLPSSLLAVYAVHGGQEESSSGSPHEFFNGLLGSYSCYREYYSMRLLPTDVIPVLTRRFGCALVALSPSNPHMMLSVNVEGDDFPKGTVLMDTQHNINAVVGKNGFLSYLSDYADRLESGIFKPDRLLGNSPVSPRSISLFPVDGDSVSKCVTRGIQVTASARWFPGPWDDRNGLNFGYSIRIRVLEMEDGMESCQLVGRHWEFMDGNGHVRQVDGEAVVGKQPLFYYQNGKSGFIDLGEAGEGLMCDDTDFVYQSQSGSVAGTSRSDTGRASVKGSFSFVPGSIDDPAGPLFHVLVGEFPLRVPCPFY